MTDQQDNKQNGAGRDGVKPTRVMNCDDIRELLTDYMARELGESRSAFVREHLRLCPACQSAAHEIARAFDLIRETEGAYPDRLSDRHRARIRRAYRHPLIAWIETHHELVSVISAGTVIILILAFVTMITVLLRYRPVREIPVDVVIPEKITLDEIPNPDTPLVLPVAPHTSPPPPPEPVIPPDPATETTGEEPEASSEQITTPVPDALEPDELTMLLDRATLESDQDGPADQPGVHSGEPVTDSAVVPASEDDLRVIRRARMLGLLVIAFIGLASIIAAFRIRRRTRMLDIEDDGVTDEGPPPLE
ncbi:MAG: hypothetical protein E4H02_08280 [Lentisphaerales bacterium]|nr:MAG: hypothetical protein E4H02_08280 [Lentisphaerales bacterium]